METSKGKKITKSSTAEYFAKNLQQVGFSSPTKAVLTTLKEALDNSLDACEEHGILPDITVEVQKVGKGSLKNTDRLRIRVEDNGPGIDLKHIPMVFGEYLASSKFGQGRCTRGQQGIGISAATTWAVQTSATGAKVLSKQKGQKKAVSCIVATDLKNNKGIVKDKEVIDWDKPHGTSVEFLIDGRVQLNGEGGVIAYLKGNILLNPHMTLRYHLPEIEPITVERVTTELPKIPEASKPHPHTMKLGEFITHARLFGQLTVTEWLQKGFSRVTDATLKVLLSTSQLQSLGKKSLIKLTTEEFEKLFESVQACELPPPPTSAVMSIGEDALSLSILRLGDIDYFAIITRKPTICDFKPVQIEVAVARLKEKTDSDDSVQILRFANRVPLQFDKSACAIVKAISSVNWKAYGLKQSRSSLPSGPYIIAVSVISPFIKFKNASKETIDASDELVVEIRRALMQAGQKLSRHLNRETKAREFEAKTQHIERFGPILVDTLCRIVKADPARKQKAEEGLKKILTRDNNDAQKQLEKADHKLNEHLAKQKAKIDKMREFDESFSDDLSSDEEGVTRG